MKAFNSFKKFKRFKPPSSSLAVGRNSQWPYCCPPEHQTLRNCHFDAQRRNLVFRCTQNARSLTPFEMTDQRDAEFLHSLAQPGICISEEIPRLGLGVTVARKFCQGGNLTRDDLNERSRERRYDHE